MGTRVQTQAEQSLGAQALNGIRAKRQSVTGDRRKGGNTAYCHNLQMVMLFWKQRKEGDG